MNWFAKLSQNNLLSSAFSVNTKKLGKVDVSISTTLEEYSRWMQYKRSADYINNSQIGTQESADRIIQMEPDFELHISHAFSYLMPSVELPERTPYEQEYEMDAFDHLYDELDNAANDDFNFRGKLGDIKQMSKIWFFKKIDDHRRIEQEEFDDVNRQIDIGYFQSMENILQQFWKSNR